MRNFSDITSYVRELANLSCENNHIQPAMYTEHQVNRGLRDMEGKGVVTGLTEVSTINAKKLGPDGQFHPCPGELYYRGIDIHDLTDGFRSEGRFGFEEAVYLLLFSQLPDGDRLARFSRELAKNRSLPPSFVRDMILKVVIRE